MTILKKQLDIKVRFEVENDVLLNIFFYVYMGKQGYLKKMYT